MSIERQQSPFLPMAPNPLSQAVSTGLSEEPINVIETDDGGAIIEFGEEEVQIGYGDNLAEHIDESDLNELAVDLIDAFEADRESRTEWEKTYLQGLDLLGLKFEDRTIPWDGACGVFHPMLSEAVVRFQSQTIQEVFPASGPAKTKIVGTTTDIRTQQAKRVQDYLNHLATENMVEYRNETERLLFSLPLAGSAFRKVYFDPSLDRISAMFVPAEDFVVAYGTSDLTTCERATHVMKQTPNQIRKLQVSGFYLDEELPEATSDITDSQKKYDELTGRTETRDQDDSYTLLEMQVDLDLAGFEREDGVMLPYVVTIDKSSRTVLAIYQNYLENDPKFLKRDHFVHYQYLPGLGFYGFGLAHMIGGLSKSATSLLRQLIDAGTLANLPGGLKARGLRIKGDDSPIMPGEFRDVDIPGGAIRDNIAFLPYKEPSTVLYQLLGDIVQEGRRFASAADVKASDMNGEAPVGTTLAILEREMKILSAVQARIHASMGKELKIISQLVKDHGPDEYPYEVDGEFTIAADFDERIDVIPVSDPNAGTMAQRIMQYQAALQLAAQAPGMYDMPRLHRQMLGVLGIEDADKVVPLEDDLHPTDPVSENMSMITGEPIKAFLYQDHEAHIQTHMAAMQHPQLMAMMKQNPQAKTVEASFTAHLSEHLAMLYRQQIEKELGVELPPVDAPLPEDIELRLSRLVAPAAAQLTGKAQQQAQAEENAKKQEDPIIKLQERELEIKEGIARDKSEQENKDRAVKEGIARDKSRQDDADRASKERIEGGKIAAKITGDQLRAKQEDAKMVSKDTKDGFELGVDLVEKFMNKPDSDDD